MNKLSLFLCLSFFCLQSFAQEEHAWVFFKDKPKEAVFLASPLTMLSQRSLDRRTTQNIALDVKDVPIEASYYSSIVNTAGITVSARSKWLNAVHVLGEIETINNLITTYSFIESIEFANDALNTGVSAKTISKKKTTKKVELEKQVADFDYGNARNQIEMLGGDFLHENGFTGEDIYVAVIDAGFPNVNTLDAFSRIRDNNQILGGYDFVGRNEDFYTGSTHGTNVLSDIAGYVEGEFIGTAPDASFYLFITEDGPNETPLEESLWVEAAERADSLGVNVINTSLGYTTFDNSDYDYSFEDMDGNTTFISRGAAIGASRGMLLVNAAGNSGNGSNKYIGAPADVETVFSIGAVNGDEDIASFSSFGPTADGRVKPDVLAQGQSVYVISATSGNAVTSNGTSFSSPVMAGVIACFWQAFPTKTNLEIMQMIRESADRYSNPTDQHGYGIPDFEALYGTVLSLEDVVSQENEMTIYPNPVNDILTLGGLGNGEGDTEVTIYSFLGKIVLEKKILSNQLDVSEIETGVYMLKLRTNSNEQTIKLIKE